MKSFDESIGIREPDDDLERSGRRFESIVLVDEAGREHEWYQR